MTAVTFPAEIGGDGSTVSDDSNASTGLANGGHRTRFVPALAQLVQIAAFMVPVAQNALNAPGTSATSVSSLTVGIGSRSLTLAQTGKTFAVGQWVQIADTAAPQTNWMHGAITAFNAGTGAMTVQVAMAAGSGTLSSWAVNPASPVSPFLSVAPNGSLLLSGAAGLLGYTAGAGATIVQPTSLATAVTVTGGRPTWRVTTFAGSIAAGASATFVVNNSLITSDVIVSAQGVGINTGILVEVFHAGGGACTVVLTNRTGGSLGGPFSLNFALTRVSTS